VRLRSSQVGRIAPELVHRWDRIRRMALARDLLPHLRLADLITHRMPFAQATEVYRLLDEHPEEALQVVLTYDEG
jgi:threonine dehydrogenase-like Zn-dependent dehydrogenase